jgi:hypothetical protein
MGVSVRGRWRARCLQAVFAVFVAVVCWSLLLLLPAESKATTPATHRAKQPKLEPIDSEAIWSQYTFPPDDQNGPESMSYLWTESEIMTNPRISFMNKVVKMLHAMQHPLPKRCRQRKLLVLQMRGTSFEGTGSLLKQVLLGIAVAAHSNRTLVWGLGLPYIYEHTQDIWQGESNGKIQFHPNSINVDCSNPDPTGGAYKCFFEAMTGCTLADASASEIIRYSANPYNDTDRLMVGDISRRGVALFHPPEGLFEYIVGHQKGPLGKGKVVTPEDIKGVESNLWVSAVAAYVFRLKPAVTSQYTLKYAASFGLLSPRPLWGFHVRHGDLKAMPDMYRYKTVFGFDDFFGVARDLSHVLKHNPRRLFISSDSPEIHDAKHLFQKFVEDSGYPEQGNVNLELDSTDMEGDGNTDADDFYYDDIALDVVLQNRHSNADSEEIAVVTKACKNLSSSLDLVGEDPHRTASMKVPKYEPVCRSWYEEELPDVFSLDNSQRYRTYHGSHTVAANGGCQKDENYDTRGMKCSLDFDTIVAYQANESHLAVPRSTRIFRAYAESVEDLYLLSQSDVLFGQGTSYFSTLASYLVWARTGCADIINTVIFLDQGHCATGLHPSAHLHGMNLLNHTYGYDPALVPHAGLARWKIHTDNFLPALEVYAKGIKLDFNPWDPRNYMHLDRKSLLPQLPHYFFYREARSWNLLRYKPVWPGGCPGGKKPEQSVATYVLEISNMGNSMHEAVLPGQAAQCWSDAKAAAEQELGRPEAVGEDAPEHLFLDNALDIVRGNLKSLFLMSYADLVINENVRDYFQVGSKAERHRKPALLPPGFMETDRPQATLVQHKDSKSCPSPGTIDYPGIVEWMQHAKSSDMLGSISSVEQADEIIDFLTTFRDEIKLVRDAFYENRSIDGPEANQIQRDRQDDMTRRKRAKKPRSTKRRRKVTYFDAS